MKARSFEGAIAPKGCPIGKRVGMKKTIFLLLGLLGVNPLLAQEREVGEGEYRGFIINKGKQVLTIAPIQPGQILQVDLTPQWSVGIGGKLEWQLSDPEGKKLRGGSQFFPQAEPISIEWASNAEGNPPAYLLEVRGAGGSFDGEILGQVIIRISLWNQNDGGSNRDAPEGFAKALALPIFDTGTYLFEEGFISGMGDPYDVYRIEIKPDHSCTVKVKPLQWKKEGPKASLLVEFLDRSLRKLKKGDIPFPGDTPFIVRVFHPKVRLAKPTTYYLMLKMEGEASLIYSLEVEVREGR